MKIPKYLNNSTIHHLEGIKRSSINFVKLWEYGSFIWIRMRGCNKN